LGSDEFALLLSGYSADAAAAVARRLLVAQDKPLALDGQQVNVTVSIGVATLGPSARNLEALLQQAAMARNVSRENRPGGWQVFAEAMNAGMRDRWQLESELRAALERGQFVLHYEPQVDLQTNLIVGVEALVRWQNARLGLVEPERFIALAEEIGLIDKIGEWVLFEACRQNQLWVAKGLAPVRVSVNVAARQFRASLTALVRSALAEARLAPERLMLEMTEGTLLERTSDTIGILSDLRAQGVSLAIDDFGTGYSSLAYLKRFPLDQLKVDQSFIRDIDRDADNLAIVGAIINLGHTLRLAVIAEGVETVAELELLRQSECDQAQGFYFARALPAADMEVLLRRSALR
jgi:EAL domain-containing protein (putative c-di-GMP-specific phosphodiesterase class I)